MRNESRGVSFFAPIFRLLPTVLLFAAVLLFAHTALSRTEQASAEEGRRAAEQSLKNAAIACYTAEGFFPADWHYLAEHYGLSIDTERYFVAYDAFAENVMPDITVLEVGK